MVESFPTTDRDLMAPDTEPSDAELTAVMRDAGRRATQKRVESTAWIAERLAAAAKYAKEHGRSKASRGG